MLHESDDDSIMIHEYLSQENPTPLGIRNYVGLVNCRIIQVKFQYKPTLTQNVGWIIEVFLIIQVSDYGGSTVCGGTHRK